jgi:FKBP-type peptidyl-prolyl cis-trans isomerase FkpA
MIKSLINGVLLVSSLLATVTGFAQDRESVQKSADDRLIKEYLTRNHLNATKTSSGLYYIITQKGSGDRAKPGQKVSMNYLGKFLDGKKFDANVDDNFKSTRPFQFTLGIGQVIKGWDEGVQLLNPGSRATFFLPSGIAYGERAMGPIPANSVLVFDVELVSVDR